MQDSSPFRWLEDRGPACHLIALIDDATGRIWGRVHRSTTRRKRTCAPSRDGYGAMDVPWAQYTDKASIFRKAGPQPLPEQLRGDALRTQFGRALNELGIEWIAAHRDDLTRNKRRPPRTQNPVVNNLVCGICSTRV